LKYWVFIIFAIFIPARATAMDLSGRLLFKDSGNTFVVLDLKTLAIKPLTERLPFSSIGGGLIKKSDKMALVATFSNLIEVNLVSGESRRIGEADYINAYLPESDTLIYITSDKDRKQRLFEAKLSDMAGTAKPIGAEVLSAADAYSTYRVVPISEHEILFPSAMPARDVWHYDLNSNALRLLENLRGCMPFFYRGITDQVICHEQQSDRYSLMDLHSEHKTYLDVLDRTIYRPIPVLYIAKHDVLIYNKLAWTWSLFSEQRNLYAYDLKTGVSTLLLEGISGWVIYLEK
jgi:hypothetical protein